MKRSSVILAIVVLVVGLSAFGVIRSSRQGEDSNCLKLTLSKVDIPAGTPLDPLIAAGDFTARCSEGPVVSGAAASIDELAGNTAYAAIYANEETPLERLSQGDGPGL